MTFALSGDVPLMMWTVSYQALPVTNSLNG